MIELSPDVKVADGYQDVLTTVEARTTGATLHYENLPAGSALTLVSDAGKLLLSVAGGGLTGGNEYQLTATLIATAPDYQSRTFTLFATVTALAKRALYQRIVNPNHPAKTLTTLRADAADDLTRPLAFAHLGEGATLTIHTGGMVSLKSPAVAGSEIFVSAFATSDDFLGKCCSPFH